MSTQLYDIQDVCDYTIIRLDEAGESLSHLKLQKLLYYVQAWHLAIFAGALFDGRFQAWIHGPVNRDVYDRFRDTKSLYASIAIGDVRPQFRTDNLQRDAIQHIDEVLEAYAGFSGSELEDMTHREDPWIVARRGVSPSARCEREIDEQIMAEYYRARIQS